MADTAPKSHCVSHLEECYLSDEHLKLLLCQLRELALYHAICSSGVHKSWEASGTLTQLLHQCSVLQCCIIVQCRSKYDWCKRRASLETLFLKALPLAIEGANASYCRLQQQHLQSM